MNGKGSKRRTEDFKKVQSNWDEINWSMIKRSQLKTGPAKLEKKDGYVNSVLAVRKDSTYCETNLYIGKWDCPNVEWYNAHLDDYEGYIELEFLIPSLE